MATAEQFTEMMDMMKAQMRHIESLTRDNTELRQGSVSTNRPNRPVVEGNWSDGEWRIFLDSWKRYKIFARLTDAGVIAMELRMCCSPEVNRRLYEFVGPSELDRSTEEQLLVHIKSVAVKGVHKEVHRLKFSTLRQQDGETVTNYVGRIKSQVALCEFTVTSTCKEEGCGTRARPTTTIVSYAEEMISHQVIAGLANHEFQSRVLSEAATLTTLDAKVNRLQTLESTEECAQLLNPGSTGPSTAAGARKKSEYKRSHAPGPKKMDRDHVKRCQTCGRSSHGPDKSMTYRDCPAKSQKCLSCGKQGHFKVVCTGVRTKSRANKTSLHNAESDTEERTDSDDEASVASPTIFL
jgi:hypothetical protein